MKYAVIAIYGWSPSRQCWMTTDNRPSSQVLLAICKTHELAVAEMLKLQADTVSDPYMPDWETPFVAVRPMQVRLPGFE